MPGISVAGGTIPQITEVLSEVIQESLKDNTMILKYVDDISSDFVEGEKYTDWKMSGVTVEDYDEYEAIKIGDVEFASRDFTLGEYKSSGVRISEKKRQDSHFMAQVLSKLPGEQAAALAAQVETDVMNQFLAMSTAGDEGVRMGFRTRFVAGAVGTGGTLDELGTVTVEDMHYINTYFKKMKYTNGRIVGILPTWQAFKLSTQAGLFQSLQYDTKVEGIYSKDLLSGMGQIGITLAGIELLTSNFTPEIASETLKTRNGSADKTCTSVGAGFFFADIAGKRPVRFCWRQQPMFDSDFDKLTQTTTIFALARYGAGEGEKENLVTVICSSSSDSAYS